MPKEIYADFLALVVRFCSYSTILSVQFASTRKSTFRHLHFCHWWRHTCIFIMIARYCGNIGWAVDIAPCRWTTWYWLGDLRDTPYVKWKFWQLQSPTFYLSRYFEPEKAFLTSYFRVNKVLPMLQFFLYFSKATQEIELNYAFGTQTRVRSQRSCINLSGKFYFNRRPAVIEWTVSNVQCKQAWDTYYFQSVALQKTIETSRFYVSWDIFSRFDAHLHMASMICQFESFKIIVRQYEKLCATRFLRTTHRRR